MSSRTDASIRKILDASRMLFFRDGLDRTSSDRVAKEAAVSKATLYRHFDSMDALFAAVVDREVDAFGQGVDFDFADAGQFRETLIQYCANLLRFLNTSDAISFAQTVAEGVRKYPQAARLFYDVGYERTHEELTRMMAQAIALRILRTDEQPRQIAEDLIGLLEGLGFVKAQLGLTKRPYAKPNEQAARAINKLLAIYGHTAAPSPK